MLTQDEMVRLILSHEHDAVIEHPLLVPAEFWC
jgi:hypothetical protein